MIGFLLLLTVCLLLDGFVLLFMLMTAGAIHFLMNRRNRFFKSIDMAPEAFGEFFRITFLFKRQHLGLAASNVNRCVHHIPSIRSADCRVFKEIMTNGLDDISR